MDATTRHENKLVSYRSDDLRRFPIIALHRSTSSNPVHLVPQRSIVSALGDVLAVLEGAAGAVRIIVIRREARIGHDYFLECRCFHSNLLIEGQSSPRGTASDKRLPVDKLRGFTSNFLIVI